jgi:RHS repeat-associated protein
LKKISPKRVLSATQLVATDTYGYNADSLLSSLSQDKGTTNFRSYTWTYDAALRLTGDTVGAGSDSYTYDAVNQLTAATHSGGGNETFSYDSNGNRTNTGYSTGTNNQLSSDGTYNYLYDANGNMTKKTTISSGAYVTYTWDYHNRLTDVKFYTSANVLTEHINYVYDVFDRLIEKQLDPTGGGTYTSKQSFVYDGDSVILAYNASNALTDRFLMLPPLSKGGPGGGGSTGADGTEAALADENGSGAVSWFLKNREGDTIDVVQYNSGTDTTSVVNHVIYGAFGNFTSQSNSAYQPLFAYTGQMWDADAGLYYYHARWYNPVIGRFISQDPSGFAAGDANLYRYVVNSPTNFTDPTGLQGTSSGYPNPQNYYTKEGFLEAWQSYHQRNMSEVYNRLEGAGNHPGPEFDEPAIQQADADLGENLGRRRGEWNSDLWCWQRKPGPVDPAEYEQYVANMLDGQARSEAIAQATMETMKEMGREVGTEVGMRLATAGIGPVLAMISNGSGNAFRWLLRVRKIRKGQAAAMATVERQIAAVEAHNAALYAKYKDTLRAAMAKPRVTDPKLAGIMEELYRPGAQIGSGSTAAAYRHEVVTGTAVGQKWHHQKLDDYIVALRRWIANNPNASSTDISAAANVLHDMMNAQHGN